MSEIKIKKLKEITPTISEVETVTNTSNNSASAKTNITYYNKHVKK